MLLLLSIVVGFSMEYGLLLSGTLRDVASLYALAETRHALIVAPWTELTARDSDARMHVVLTSPALDAHVARALDTRGIAMRQLSRTATSLTLKPLRTHAPTVSWTQLTVREAPSLIEALRPLRVVGDPAATEAIFCVPAAHPSAHRLIERLLLLGRDDVAITEMRDGDGTSMLMLRMSSPPMYLLLRAREEPDEAVTAYVRDDEGPLWVEWSWMHPLARVTGRVLRDAERMALVDRRGVWRFSVADPPTRSIYDLVVPHLDATRVDMQHAPGDLRLNIRLQLSPAAPNDPELWVLDSEQFLALDAWIEMLTPEEIARFMVARTAAVEEPESLSGARYVLQELVRPNAARLGARITDMTRARGFARLVGTDNVYLPTGRQILPRMRRDELRTLLGADRAQLVIVDEDLDGPRLLCFHHVELTSLTRWIDYVATDRRTAFERIQEDSVFDWPELKVEQAPPSRDERDTNATKPSAVAPPPRTRPRVAPSVPDAVVAEAREPRVDVLAAVREEIRALEAVVARGGCTDDTWRALGERKARVNDLDDAAMCLEASLFHGAMDVDVAAVLASHRQRALGTVGSNDELLRFVTAAQRSPSEGAYLAARVIELRLRGTTIVDDGFFQQAERVLTDPEAPISRRLAWLVARVLHGATGDRLGLTRARERVLGGINTRGLHENFDMPRFVRGALALTAGATPAERAYAEQLQSLEALWALAQRDLVNDVEVMSTYLRFVFAVGFARLGASARGRVLIDHLEAEMSVHEAPNQVLFGLYRARFAHMATGGDHDTWRREVEGRLAQIKEPRIRDRVEWLRARSEWLRSGPIAKVGTGLRPSVERALVLAEASPQLAPRTLIEQFGERGLFDYEMSIIIERMLHAALASGNDDLLVEVLIAALERQAHLKVPKHRVAAMGKCIHAAATLGDGARVDHLLDDVVALAGSPEAPSVHDLLLAVQPGLAALRRLGVSASARRFLEALLPVAKRGQREGVKLRAALADGFLHMRDTEQANALMDQCLDDTIEGTFDHVGRYDAGVSVLLALKRWPMTERLPRCERVLAALHRFSDAYSAGLQGLYATHKVLISERLIDAVVDDVTFQSDRVQGYLDDEELAIRRRINADWRDLCGR